MANLIHHYYRVCIGLSENPFHFQILLVLPESTELNPPNRLNPSNSPGVSPGISTMSGIHNCVSMV